MRRWCVDALGAGVSEWSEGQRAGVGWNGGYCGYCDNCRRGDFFACLTATYVTGITSDGGYADYLIARSEAVARVPEELTPVEAAPLMCAGLTTYNSLRNSGAKPGEVVAILGLGGLGASWVCSTPRRWVTGRWRSHAGRIRPSWPQTRRLALHR